MAIFRKNNLQQDLNTGFGTNSSSTGGRFINRDGKPNVIKKGVGLLNRYSWYHTMLGMRRGKFLSLLFVVYILVNILFAGVYYLIGSQHLAGIDHTDPVKEFTEIFFFSTQTFTTVGYGRISPSGFLTSAVSTFEAFLGLLSFAIATGLFYGRFSRPRIFLKFSDKALISPYRGGTALMFRVAPYKNNNLSDVEVKLTMAVTTEENGKLTDKFYDLDLEYGHISGLALSWTIVHPIDEKSPFFGWTSSDIAATDIELMVYVKAFDQVFSNNVITRTSYISSEIVWGAKFKMMYEPNEDKSKTILDLGKLNDIDTVTMPASNAVPATA
ncbi:MAG: Inward rectifier potassium channel Irk [Chitinophagaceae bacterium]|nr:Inward rectifier potassium channel Irk [Chitinophagaceae bacterium]